MTDGACGGLRVFIVEANENKDTTEKVRSGQRQNEVFILTRAKNKEEFPKNSTHGIFVHVYKINNGTCCKNIKKLSEKPTDALD